MYLYVELWKPRPAWHALDATKRSEYVAGIGPAIGELTAAGVELVGFAFNDDDTEYRADYAYLAVWRMPSKDLACELEKAVIGAGFHEYFEQVNARGPVVPPDDVLGHMQRV